LKRTNASSITAPRLARNHRERKVPWRDAGDDADRLFDDDNAFVRLVTRNRVAVHALGFLPEPLEERRRVRDFAFRFGKRLPLLGRHQAREVVLIGHHQFEPAAHDRRSFLRRSRAPGGQRAVRGLDRARRIGGAKARHRADDVAGRGVVDVDHGSAGRRDPGAVDVARLAEQTGILKGNA
jgi:hypothetical protein